MKRRDALWTSVLSVAALGAAADPGAPGTHGAPGRSFIVQLVDPPVAAYSGGVAGLRATQPASGQALDMNHPDVLAYLGHLKRRQDAVIATLGAVAVSYRYTTVLNGFAAVLTEAQVALLRRNPDVLSVQPDEVRKLQQPQPAPNRAETD